MEIEPISSVGGVAVPAVSPVQSGHPADESPEQLALAEAQAKESQTLEERAEDGDPIALAQLAEDEKQNTPIDSQQLLPPPPARPVHPAHPPGAHEPGKGTLVDIYD